MQLLSILVNERLLLDVLESCNPEVIEIMHVHTALCLWFVLQ